ncbi:MAG: hypothetical protein GY953_41300, partial [bacterium]|nr:hypothetical protein [bacterium]
EDVRRLFVSNSEEPSETLIRPESLVADFERRFGAAGEILALVPGFLEEVGGFKEWRTAACFADTQRILRFARRPFDALIHTPIPGQHQFADEAGCQLVAFVARHFPNIGFGAKFIGSEGLDPDGVHILAEATLILHPDLRGVFERIRCQDDAPSTTRTMRIIPCRVRPNVAYMLSLAQGIRPHTIRNLKRFESFHDRPHMPEDRTFPLSGDEQQGSINHISGYRDLANVIKRSFDESSSDP